MSTILQASRTALPSASSQWLTVYARACEDMPETTKQSNRENVRTKPTTLPVEKEEKNASIACPIDNEKHHLGKCPDFLKKLVQERINFVRSSNLCFNCLSPRHKVEDCKSTLRCQVTNCGKRHHTSLRRENQGPASTSTKPGHSNHKNTPIQKIASSDTKFAENKASEFEPTTAFDTSTKFKHQAASRLQTVPIRVHGDQGFVDCYALIDTCSTASYILNRTVNTLSIQPKRTIELQLTSIYEQSLLQAGIASLKIGTSNSKRPLFTLINVQAVDSMKLRPPDVKRLNAICQTFTHLNHVSSPCLPDKSVHLLLGIDAFQYIATREILQGPKPSPFAVRKLLGWTVTGPLSVRTSCSSSPTNFTAHHIHENDVLTQMAQRLWLADSGGTESTTPSKNTITDQQALKFLEENMRHTGERYEVGLTWKEKVELQNNYPVAKAQLK